MRSFTESGIQFTFNRDWVVKKYDSHRYYQGLSGKGLKGVDFIALNFKEKLVAFFEVKNYRTRFHQNTGEAIHPDPKPTDDLAQTLSEKVSDTLLAIAAITIYYEKSWWYRWWHSWYIRLPFYTGDRFFWSKVANCIYVHENIHFILWVEQQERDVAYLSRLQRKTEVLLQGETGRVYLADSSSHPYPHSLEVVLDV